jgi:oxygen-independent coproporphyrinogen-3 oxidase
MEEISLYIHIPFCEQKCNYCAFASFCASDEVKEEYIDILCNEIKNRATKKLVKTIYIGGGTPSVLTCAQFEKVVAAITDNFELTKDAEFTVEANPNSITEEKLVCWKRCRVNRVSIGVQSLKDKSLKKIGRLHDKKTAISAVKLARKYFDNVSADLIVGLEGESGKDLCSHARQLLELGVKHISCYLLEIYENTKIFAQIEAKEYRPLTDEQMVGAFGKLSNFLVDKGMERYEISNFAFEGYESRHNLNYWSRGEYLGFGLGAHSFEKNRRYCNASTLSGYKCGIVQEELLSDKEVAEEVIMLGLRCRIGVSLRQLRTLGYDLTQNEFYADYIAQGILAQNGDVVHLKPLFYHISNTIISNLMP